MIDKEDAVKNAWANFVRKKKLDKKEEDLVEDVDDDLDSEPVLPVELKRRD